jgi:hypothetical protein
MTIVNLRSHGSASDPSLRPEQPVRPRNLDKPMSDDAQLSWAGISDRCGGTLILMLVAAGSSHLCVVDGALTRDARAQRRGARAGHTSEPVRKAEVAAMVRKRALRRARLGENSPEKEKALPSARRRGLPLDEAEVVYRSVIG